VPLVPDQTNRSMGGPTERAQDLLVLLQDQDKYPTVASFPALVAHAQQDHLLAEGNLRGVPAHWTVTHSPTSPGPAVAFATHHRIQGTSLKSVLPILITSNWMTYKPPWCAMDPAASGGGLQDRKLATSGTTNRIVELVADDCNLDNALYAFQTCLDFLHTNLPDGGAILEYRRSPQQKSNGGDGAVTVDEGSLVVQQVGPDTVDVVTTKRVQFLALRGIPAFAAGMLAQFTWVLGYTAMAELFVEKVMKGAAANGPVTVIHPGAIPKGPIDRLPYNGLTKAGGAKKTGKGKGKGFETVVSETMKDCRDGARSSLKKVASGDYGPDDYGADVARVIGHGRRHVGAVAQFWSEALTGDDGNGGSKGKAE
jgi:hypothetical protein